MYMMHWQNRQSATSDQTRLRLMCPNAAAARARRAKFFAKIHGTEANFVVRAGAPVYAVAVSFVYLQIIAF